MLLFLLLAPAAPAARSLLRVGAAAPAARPVLTLSAAAVRRPGPALASGAAGASRAAHPLGRKASATASGVAVRSVNRRGPVSSASLKAAKK